MKVGDLVKSSIKGDNKPMGLVISEAAMAGPFESEYEGFTTLYGCRRWNVLWSSTQTLAQYWGSDMEILHESR